jgi:hypothetical protein
MNDRRTLTIEEFAQLKALLPGGEGDQIEIVLSQWAPSGFLPHTGRPPRCLHPGYVGTLQGDVWVAERGQVACPASGDAQIKQKAPARDVPGPSLSPSLHYA